MDEPEKRKKVVVGKFRAGLTGSGEALASLPATLKGRSGLLE
jgi:hypothetical protein